MRGFVFAAVGLAVLASSCLFSEGWSIQPCGSSCAAAPEAVAANDAKNWGTYKGVYADNDRSAAFTCTFPEGFAKASSSCRVRFGDKDLVASPAMYYDETKLQFQFTTPTDSSCVSPDCYPVPLYFTVDAAGKATPWDNTTMAVRKETSSSQVKAFEGRFVMGDLNPYCAFVLQGDKLSGGCNISICRGDRAVFADVAVTGGKFTVDTPVVDLQKSTHYEGTFSADGLSLSGTWKNEYGSGTWTADRTL